MLCVWFNLNHPGKLSAIDELILEFKTKHAGAASESLLEDVILIAKAAAIAAGGLQNATELNIKSVYMLKQATADIMSRLVSVVRVLYFNLNPRA